MKALILCGGKGTRLQPITHTHAKQLVPIANKPVVFYVIESIVAAGINDIGIIVGDTAEEVKAAIGDGRRFGPSVSMTYIHQNQPLGLAHAVKIAQPFLQQERFLMFLGDNFLEENIAPLVQQFSAADCPYHAQVMFKGVAHPEQFGVAQLCTSSGQMVTSDTQVTDEPLHLVRLIEKPKQPVSNLALVGAYFFDEHIFAAIDAIHPSARGELEITDAIQYLLDHGYHVHPHFLRGHWIDTGKMQDMLDANRAVLSQLKSMISSGVTIDQRSELSGEVILEENAHLINSIVCGPSIIGRNVTLSNAYIGPFTSIDHGGIVTDCEIEHSIIMEGCHIANIEGRIVDSLIGRHTQIFPTLKRSKAYNLLLGDNSRVNIL